MFNWKLAMENLMVTSYSNNGRELANKELKKHLEMFTKSELIDLLAQYGNVNKKRFSKLLKSDLVEVARSTIEGATIGW